MATLAKLVVKLVTDVTEFTSGLDTASKKLTKVGQNMEKVGIGMTKAVTLPIVAAGAAAINMASDLEEARNKANVVFGEMAAGVREFALGSADSYGMSENAALGFLSTYGAILKNMGLSQEEVAKMSVKLTQLTADYASFHNLKPEEAFEKIRAGLVGSSEPLLSLGKDLRQGAVEAYAMANGIGTAGEALSMQEVTLARYGLLLSQSNDEMGDFGRTADGLANSTRTLKAQMENMLAGFGEVLIPALTDFLNALVPILKWFNNLPPAVKTGIVYFMLFMAAIGPLLTVGGKLAQLLGWITKAFSAKTAAAGAATAASGKLGISIGGLAAKLGLAGKGLTAVLAGMSAMIAPAILLGVAIAELIIVWQIFGDQFKATLKIIGEGFKSVVTSLFKNAFEIAKQWREQGRSWAIGLAYGWISGWYSMASQVIKAVWNMIVWPFEQAVKAVKMLLKISSPSKVFQDIGMNMMLGLEDGIQKYAPKSIDANIKAVDDMSKVSAAGIKSGGKGASVSIGEIKIQGDLSESAKISLRKEIRQIFGQELKAVME